MYLSRFLNQEHLILEMKPDSCWELYINVYLYYMQIDHDDSIVYKCIADNHLLASIKEGDVNIRCITAIKGVHMNKKRDRIVWKEISRFLVSSWDICFIRLFECGF